MISGLGANLINVTNLSLSKKWYEEIIGMKTIEYRPPAFLEMTLGDNTFYIETESDQREEGFKKEIIGGKTSIVFTVEDLKGTIEKMRSQGVKIIVEPVQQFWGGWNAKISDPDGNIFILDEDSN